MQPLTVNFAFGNLALAHNGNLINATMLRHELEAYGAIFQSTTDSEVIIHLIAHSRADSLVGTHHRCVEPSAGRVFGRVDDGSRASLPREIHMDCGRSAWDGCA